MTSLECGRLLLLLGFVAADSGRHTHGARVEIGSSMMNRRFQNASIDVFDFASGALHSQGNMLTDAHRLRGATNEADATSHRWQRHAVLHPVLEDSDSEADLANRLKLPLEADGQVDLPSIDKAMHACLLTYLLTHGTFYAPSLDRKTIKYRIQLQKKLAISQSGWRRHPELDLNPVESVNGVHGIVFTNDFNQAIIAIRGTDLPKKTKDCVPHSGCRADLCADKKLWDIPWKIIDKGDLPEWCTNESAVHDYPKLAADFVERTLAALPEHDVMLVGHSLGAGLALITAARILREHKLPAGTSMQVVAVSPPPFASFLDDHDQTLDNRFVVIYNELDPLLFATRDRGGFCGATPMCYNIGDTKKVLRITCEKECHPSVMEGKKPAVFGTVWPAETCDECWNGAHKLRPYLKASQSSHRLAKCSSLVDL